MATDFEAEGLLEGIEGEEARGARLDLLRDLEQKGFALEDLRAAVAERRLPVLPIEHALEGTVPQYTMAEVAEQSGLDTDVLKALNSAVGLARPGPDERAFTDADVDAARNARQAIEAGLPEAEMLEIVRVTSRSAAAVAAAAFASVGEAFARAGDTERDLGLRYAEATRALTPLLGQSLERLLLVHLRELARQTAVTDEQLSTGRLPEAQVIGVCFADLVGFTRLGEELEPEEIGAVAGRLGKLTDEVLRPPVRLVKTIGDAVMLVSPEPEPDPLLDVALALVDAIDDEGEGFPELRAGLALGPAMPRAGDWYGRAVNLASRITSFARPGSVVADKATMDAAGDWAWSFAGRRRFKGVREEVPVFRVRRAQPEDES